MDFSHYFSQSKMLSAKKISIVTMAMLAMHSPNVMADNIFPNNTSNNSNSNDFYQVFQKNSINWNLQNQPKIDFSNHQRLNTQNNPYQDLPDFGGQVGLISRQQEAKVGEKVLRLARRELPQVQDAWLQQQIEQLFQQIYSQTGLGQPLAVMVINDKQINAFAVPGGVFAINTGTITSAGRLDEVVGVIAHEVAHVSQRHYSRSKDNAKLQSAWSWLGMLAGIALATQSGEAGTAVMMGSQAMGMNGQLRYSREQEREADRIGMQYLAGANYRPNSMADFFENMQKQSTQLSVVPDFWLTHPLTQERMSEARLRSQQYNQNSTQNRQSSQNEREIEQQQYFELIKWRAMILQRGANLEQLKTATQRNPAAALALANHYIQQSLWQDAEKILQDFQPTRVQMPIYQLTQADLWIAQQRYNDALQLIGNAYQLNPENRAFALKLAEIQILMGQTRQADNILQPLSRQRPHDVYIWQLLQQSAQQQSLQALNKQDSDAARLAEINTLRYRAESLFWRGEESEAIKNLQHAKRLDDSKPTFASQINQRLQAMQDAQKEK
ncbi:MULTISPECIES: M48 family metalloprotease [unclassified Acinetobacter]|uniref:M48 family metalloprotease n=1 Tax=unclassified Acinetobacter TaxID=196816 RepID=UPI0035B8D1F6